MGEWMGGWVGACVCVDGWVHARMDDGSIRYMGDARMDKWANGCIEERVSGWVGG